MTKKLAQHCELAFHDDSNIRLRLAPANRSLLDKQRQDTLQSALQTYFGSHARLEIDVAEQKSETPAQRATTVQSERQQNAAAAIKRDPVVREMIDLFGAGIDESSIKPI